MRRLAIIFAVLFSFFGAAGAAQADGWHYSSSTGSRIEAHPSSGDRYPYLICHQQTAVSDGTPGDYTISGINQVTCVDELYTSGDWRNVTYWNFDEELWNAFTKVRDAPDSPGGNFSIGGAPARGLQVNWTDVAPILSPNWWVKGIVTIGLKSGWEWTSVASNCSVWPGGQTVVCTTNSPMTGH